MATTVTSYQHIMQYDKEIWHIDYTAHYPDVDDSDSKKDVPKGMLTIKTIYGDTSNGSVIEAMRDFAAVRGLDVNWDGVQCKAALEPETKTKKKLWY